MFIRQIVGFAILVAFLWVLGFIHGLFGATGMPDLLAWILAVAVELVAVAGLFAGWQWLQARRILSKPGVREWKDLDDRAFALHKRGDLAAAEPLYEQALPQAEKTGQPLMVANAANNLGGLRIDQERYAEALPLFERAYEVRKEALGAEDGLTLKTAERVTNALAAMGRWEEVEKLQRELLPIYRKQSDDGPPAVETLDLIAVACRHQRKYEEAGTLFREGEELLTRKGELDSQAAGTLYNDWAYMLVAAGSAPAAPALYAKAIAIREHSTDRFALAVSLDNLADAQAATGDVAGAAVTADRWFPIIDQLIHLRSGAGDPPELVIVLDQYRRRLEMAGRQSDAVAIGRRAEAIRTQHPATVADMERQQAAEAAAG